MPQNHRFGVGSQRAVFGDSLRRQCERLKMFQNDQAVSVGFNHRGDLLVTSGWDGKTRLWDFPACRPLVGIYQSGHIVGFNSDDRKMALCFWDGTGLLYFDLACGQGVRPVHEREPPSPPPFGEAFFNSTGRLLAYPTAEGVRVWDVQENREAGTLANEDLYPVGFDAQDGSLLAMGSKGFMRGPIKESSPGGPINLGLPILAHGGKLGAAVATADGKFCLLAEEGRWPFFRTDTFTELANIEIQRGDAAPTISPDGTLPATGAWQRPATVKVWNARTGKLLKELPAGDDRNEGAASVAFSPDGRYLVDSNFREYCIWEVRSWSLVRRIPQQAGNDLPAKMAFSRDGKIFAGTHSRNVVRLHDAATGEVLADLEAPYSKYVTSLCFNRDGTLLAACESRNALRIWDLRLIRERLAELGLD